MKKIVFLLVSVILIAACKGNGNKPAEEEKVNLELDSISDSLSLKVDNNTVDVDVKVVYPTNMEAINKDLMNLVKLTGQGDDFEAMPTALRWIPQI